jgi:hypothetical protein
VSRTPSTSPAESKSSLCCFTSRCSADARWWRLFALANVLLQIAGLHLAITVRARRMEERLFRNALLSVDLNRCLEELPTTNFTRHFVLVAGGHANVGRDSHFSGGRWSLPRRWRHARTFTSVDTATNALVLVERGREHTSCERNGARALLIGHGCVCVCPPPPPTYLCETVRNEFAAADSTWHTVVVWIIAARSTIALVGSTTKRCPPCDLGSRLWGTLGCFATFQMLR